MIVKAKLFLFVFSVLALVLMISCESNFKEVQKSTFAEFTPSGEADDINMKYTDSGRIKSILISPKMLDYATVEFPFTEFPKGMHLTLYDKNGKETYIEGNYATSDKSTNIIDLQGKVKISNQNGEQLETEQLYYDQKNEWFFIINSKFTNAYHV